MDALSIHRETLRTLRKVFNAKYVIMAVCSPLFTSDAINVYQDATKLRAALEEDDYNPLMGCPIQNTNRHVTQVRQMIERIDNLAKN